jgi:hypothetical protein
VKSLSGLTAFASRCDLDAVTQGQWVQAFDHQALEDFATPRQLQYPDDFHCYAEDGRSLDEARLVRAANWVWQPRSAECAHLPAVDRFVILDRLLRMPEGAVFIGGASALPIAVVASQKKSLVRLAGGRAVLRLAGHSGGRRCKSVLRNVARGREARSWQQHDSAFDSRLKSTRCDRWPVSFGL